MSYVNGNMPSWLNGTFILTCMGMCGAGIGYILLFLLKSRCTTIKCCCISCNRTPLNIEELQTVSITPPMVRNSQSSPPVDNI